MSVVQQQVERPRQPCRGGLVAGNEQRHELVAKLRVGHLVPLVVPSEQQRGEDVLALLEIGYAPSPRDLVENHLVQGAAPLFEAANGSPVTQAASRQGKENQREAARNRVEHRANTPLQLILARPFLDAEHGAHDHVERERLHRREKRERPAHGPPVDHCIGRRVHDQFVGPHSLPVERRQHQSPLAQVLVPVEKQDRALAEDGSEQRVRLPGTQLLGRRLEHLLHHLRVEHHHEPGVEQGAERNDVPVTPPAELEETRPADQEAERLQKSRQARPWRHPVLAWRGHRSPR